MDNREIREKQQLVPFYITMAIALAVLAMIIDRGIVLTISDIAKPFIYVWMVLALIGFLVIAWFFTKEIIVGIWLIIKDMKMPKSLSPSDILATIFGISATIGVIAMFYTSIYALYRMIIGDF